MYYTWLHDDPNDVIDEVLEDDIINHRLIPITINYNCNENIWNIKSEGYANGSFKATDDRIKKLFRYIKAKDSIKLPNSRKKVTYQMMIDEVKSDKYNQIYVWKSRIPTDLDTMKKLME